MTSSIRLPLRLLAWLTAALLLFTTTSAFAQTIGLVQRDPTIIWRIDGPQPAAIVPIGTSLEVVAVRDGYYEVLIPERFGGMGERGRVLSAALKLTPAQDVVRGVQPDTRKPPARPNRVTPPRSEQTPTSITSAPASSDEPAVAFRGFGSVGVAQFAARQSFEAIFGDARGVLYGAGVQLRLRSGLFIQGSVDRFSRTGERVFVFDDTLFPLGIDNTVTITPLHVTAGYRTRVGRSIAPYGGGGISIAYLKQTTEFDLPDESYQTHGTGFNALGGIEFRISRSVWMAGELRYEHFANLLGSGGVSQLFDEHNLGGMRTQFKMIFGR